MDRNVAGAWFAVGSTASLTCPTGEVAEENNCGNSAGDPFDTLTGAQMDPFVDIDAPGIGFRMKRTFTTYANQDLLNREVKPEAVIWSSPFGISWHWEYGLFLYMKKDTANPEMALLDKDGIIKRYRMSAPGRWVNERGEGEVRWVAPVPAEPAACQVLNSCLRLFRPSGQQVTFAPTNGIVSPNGITKIWRIIKLEEPDTNLSLSIEYGAASSVLMQKPSVIRSNKGGEIRFTWTGESVYRWSGLNARYFETDIVDNNVLRKVQIYSSGVLTNTIEYSYDTFQGPYILGVAPVPSRLTAVKVDGATRWSYTYDLWKLKTFKNGRDDLTTLFWGPNGTESYRGSNLKDASGKIYEDLRITWTGNATTLQSKVSALADRINQTRKETIQTFQALPYEKRGAKIRKLTSVIGYGCASCGLGGAEQFTYSPYDGQMLSKCDQDGILTKYTYDVYGSVVTTSTLLGDPSCPGPAHIIAQAEAVESNQKNTNSSRPGGAMRSTQPSVLLPGGLSSTIQDFDDPALDATPDEPNDSMPSAKLQGRINRGYTRTIYGAIEEKVYRTKYIYELDLDITDGPRNDVLDLQKTYYYPGTRTIQFTDVYAGSGVLRTEYSDYDQYGNPKRIVAPNGLVTIYLYNNWNKPAVVTQVGAGTNGEDIVTQYFYDGAGDLDYIILPEGNAVDYDYVARGLLVSIRRLKSADANGNKGPVIDEIIYEYDPEGNRTLEERYVGPKNGGVLTSSTKTKYDLYNHVQSVINGVGKTRTTKYSPSGLLLESTDEIGNTTTYWYDALKRLYSVRAPDGGETRYGYDTRNNLTGVASCRVAGCDLSPTSFDPNKVVNHYLYDDFGRLVRSESPDSGVTDYEYDEAGNLIAKLDSRGQLSQYQYDAANRLIAISYAGSSLATSYYYDDYPDAINAQGRLAAAHDEAGVTIYAYDMAGRTTAETRRTSYVLNVQTQQWLSITNWIYDRNGNVREIRYPTGVKVYYDPDPNDQDRVLRVRLETELGSKTIAENIVYSPGNLIRAMQLGNGLSSSWSRDTAERISQLRLGQPGNATLKPAVALNYAYYDNSNIATIVDSNARLVDQAYNYDSVNRLTDAIGPFGSRAFAYDSVGNRITDVRDGKSTNYYYASPSSNKLLATIDASYQPPAATSLTVQSTLSVSSTSSLSTNAATPQKKAAITRILNDLNDLFFSGERLMRQALGLGSFSEGKSSDHRTDLATATSAFEQFTRKATDTTLLLKESLASGLLTQSEVKEAAANDSRLQSLIDLFFEDLQAIPTEKMVPFFRSIVGIFTSEDIQLLSEILDLAGRITFPQPAPTSLGNAKLLVALTNQANPADTVWRATLDNARVIMGLSPRQRSLTAGSLSLSGNQTLSVEGEIAIQLDELKSHLQELRAMGVRPSQAVRDALLQPGMDTLLFRLARSKSAMFGMTADEFTLMATAQLTVLPFPGNLYLSDMAGNLTSWQTETNETPYTMRNYEYSADNRLHSTGSTTFAYDHLGRRIFGGHTAVLENLGQTGYEPQFWAYDQTGSMLTWSRVETIDGAASVYHTESYIYLNGERLAKVLTEKSVVKELPGGGGGGGGCCCASTAIAYDGRAQCDIQSFHALQVLRGFRNTILSGTSIGEWVIDHYYHTFSPVAVPVLREYPEIRHALNYVLQAVAWGMEFWVQPAVAMEVVVGVSFHNENFYWYHNDHLGTPLALSDKDGVVVAEWKRDPFGMVVSKTGSVDDNNMFPGQFWDADARLAYNWNRWYSPEIGRFTSPDPLLALGQYPMPGIAGLLAYPYADNNSLTNIDPSGLIGWTVTMGYAGGGPSIAGMLGVMAGAMYGEAESDCVNGCKSKCKFVVGFGGGTLSPIPFAMGVSWGGQFESTSRNASQFSGVFKMGGAGYSWGYGGGCSAMKIGQASSASCGQQAGVDVGATGLVGYSSVVWSDDKVKCN